MQEKEDDKQALIEAEKSLMRYIIHNNTYISSETILPLNEVLKRLNRKTLVDTKQADILVKDIPCCNLYIPKAIAINKKRSTYRAMVNCLVYNNYHIEFKYVFSYIYYINLRFTDGKPLFWSDLIKTVATEYLHIIETGEIKLKQTRRYNTSNKLPKKERIKVARMARGGEQINNSIQLIKTAVTLLQLKGIKPTQVQIKSVLKNSLSMSSIKRYSRFVLK